MSKLKQKIFNKTQEPVIYLRYINGVVSYIGETEDWKKGRPFRDGGSFDQKDNAGDYDEVRLLKANFNSERRRYWEAVLITKYKPFNQQKVLKKYYTLTNKKIEKDEMLYDHFNNQIKIMRKNTNNKLKLAAKIHLLKHYEIMLHIKKIESEDSNGKKN